MLKIGLG